MSARRTSGVSCAALLSLGLHVIALSGCSSSSFEGNPVDVKMESGANSVLTSAGQWQVEEFLLAPTAVEIVPCVVVDGAAAREAASLKHVESTPFQSGTSLVWPVVGGDENQYQAGAIEPPTDEYCSVRLLFAPLDNDGIRGAEYPELVGDSFRLRATLSSSTSSAPTSVFTRTTLRVETEVQLDNAPVLIDGPAELILAIDVGSALSDVDPDAATTDVARSVLSRIPNAVSARVSQ